MPPSGGTGTVVGTTSVVRNLHVVMGDILAVSGLAPTAEPPHRPGVLGQAGRRYDPLPCRLGPWRFGTEMRAGERSQLPTSRVSVLSTSQTSRARASETSFRVAQWSSNGETTSNRTDVSGEWRGSKRPERFPAGSVPLTRRTGVFGPLSLSERLDPTRAVRPQVNRSKHRCLLMRPRPGVIQVIRRSWALSYGSTLTGRRRLLR